MRKINDVVDDAQKIIKEAYCMGEIDGALSLSASDDNYSHGFSDAWEFAKKVVLEVNEGGLLARDVLEIFGKANFREILKEFSPQEVIDRFRKYASKINQEQKEDSGAEIKIGDEVTNVFCDKGIVLGFATFRGHEEMSLLMPNYPVPQMVEKKDYAKTGRHFPQIADFIKGYDIENIKEMNNANK